MCRRMNSLQVVVLLRSGTGAIPCRHLEQCDGMSYSDSASIALVANRIREQATSGRLESFSGQDKPETAIRTMA
jgi:hypothetical protein